MSVMLPDPPSWASILAVSGSSVAAWTMSWGMAPKDSPATTAPIVQPSRVPRWSRQAKARGLSSQGGASAGPSRVGSAPAPTSRRTSNADAATSRTASRATGSSRTHQRSPAKGWGPRAQQTPPPPPGNRPNPPAPADRRQPRQPRQLAGAVADGPEQEDGAQH